MRAAGYRGGDDSATYEEIRDYVTRDEYDVRFGRERFIREELKLLESIPQLVARRRWLIVVAAPGSGGFITCDHPASPAWSDPQMQRFPPGLGLHGTQLLLPLSPDVAVVGAFEARETTIKFPPSVLPAVMA
jgi:hypothetical protein